MLGIIYMWNLKRKVELIEIESRKLVARSGAGVVEKIGRGRNKVQTFSCKINNSVHLSYDKESLFLLMFVCLAINV